LTALYYVSQRLRHRDVQVAANLLQLCQIYAPVHHRVTVGTDCNEVAQRLGNGLIFHHVTGWCFRRAASDAIEFAGLTRLFVLHPLCPKDSSEVATENQYRSLVIAYRKSPLDPLPHGIPVDIAQTGNFFHGVVAVNFCKARVWVMRSHSCSRLAARFNLLL
jgi:hypothetical protein